MIWGTTYKEDNKCNNSLKKWFAWYPVILDDGRTAWLCWLWCNRTPCADGCNKAYNLVEK